MALSEVWKEDVTKEAEYLGEGARNLANFYHAAKAQGAPESLLAEMAQVWTDLDNARRRLENIIPCFPEEPRGRR